MEKDKLLKHNQFQRHYYENALDKPAMQINDTPYVRRHIARMVRHAHLLPDQKILEIGAGLGKFSIPLLQAGFNLSCNDLSSIQLEHLCAHAPMPVTTLAGDIIDINTQTMERFDRAIGFFTLHHMVNLTAVFGGIRKILRPGAEITFIEPMGKNPLYYMQIALTPGMKMRAERGILNMSDRVVHKAMRNAGLEPLPSISYGFAPPFMINRSWGAKLDDYLGALSWLNWAHAFLILRARNP